MFGFLKRKNGDLFRINQLLSNNNFQNMNNKQFLNLIFAALIFSMGFSAAYSQDTTSKLLNTKVVLSNKVAKQIAELVEQEAVKNKLNVSIAIVNDAGQLIYFSKMDDSHNASTEISIAKAKSAALFRRDTKVLKDALDKGNLGILALPNAIATEGGVQLIYQGKSIGAIGVSGASSEEDGKIAKVGAEFLLNLK
jgi:glc operon protein GlcG